MQDRAKHVVNTRGTTGTALLLLGMLLMVAGVTACQRDQRVPGTSETALRDGEVGGRGLGSQVSGSAQAREQLRAPSGEREVVTREDAGITGDGILGPPKIEPWTFEGPPEVPGQMLGTRSFRIFTTSVRADTASQLPAFMESALSHYVSAIAQLPRPEGTLDLYMMANRSQWEQLTRTVMGSSADTYLMIERGGFTARGRSVLWELGRRDTYAIAAHEGWHLYTQRVFRDPLPVGLEEGIATYMEGFRWSPREQEQPTFLPWANGERFWQLREASNADRLADIDALLLSTPQDLMSQGTEGALDYYAQVWALTQFLMEGDGGKYRPALVSMVDDAAAGRLLSKVRESLGPRAASIHSNRRRGVDVLSVYTGVASKELNASYKAFVKHIVRSGAGQRVWRGQSPVGE